MTAAALERVAAEARACTLCHDLPLGPLPVFRVSPTARLLIIGQAPGTKVHATGIPWNDPSGDRLRVWLWRLFHRERVAMPTFESLSGITPAMIGSCEPNDPPTAREEGLTLSALAPENPILTLPRISKIPQKTP